MSVPWNPPHVARTLNVPTVTVPTSVPANRDILETESRVKVNAWLTFYRFKFEYGFMSKDALYNFTFAKSHLCLFLATEETFYQKHLDRKPFNVSSIALRYRRVFFRHQPM